MTVDHKAVLETLGLVDEISGRALLSFAGLCWVAKVMFKEYLAAKNECEDIERTVKHLRKSRKGGK